MPTELGSSLLLPAASSAHPPQQKPLLTSKLCKQGCQAPQLSLTSNALLIYVLNSTTKPLGYDRFVFPKKKPDHGSLSINSSARIETQVKGGESWGWGHELSSSLLALFHFLNGVFSLDLLNVSHSEFAECMRGKRVTAIRG